MKKIFGGNKIKILDTYYVILVGLIFVIEFIILFKKGSFDFPEFENLKINISNLLQIFYYLFLVIFLVFVDSILKISFLTVIYLGIRFSTIKHHKEQNMINSSKENHEYYREILKEYSPAVLSYINDFNVNENTVFITFMSLENKRVISFKNEIEIIDESIEKINLLDKTEKYIFEIICSKDFNNFNISNFKKTILEECVSLNLIEERKKKKIIRLLLIPIVIYVANFIFFLNSTNIFNSFNMSNPFLIISSFLIMVISFLIIILLPESFIIYILYYLNLIKKDPFIRSKNGTQIKQKLMGLKNYINEFGDFENKEKEEIIIWEDYIIYSVMLGINQKIISKYKNNVKIKL